MVNVCTIPGCGRRRTAYGLCHPHRHRQRRYGDPMADIPIGGLRPYTPAPLLAIATRHEWSAQQFADRVGVTRRTIVRWRNKPNTQLTLDEADRYALALNQDLDDLWETP